MFEHNPRIIEYRALNAVSDMPRLRELHDVCFPVKYDDRYYQWLSSPHCIALVATAPAMELHSGVEMDTVPSASTAQQSLTTSTAAASASTSRDVVGFVIGKIKYVEGPLLMNPVVYIATFGVDPDLQGRGVGHELLERFVAHVSDPAFLNAPACADFAAPASGWGLRAVLNRFFAPKPLSQVWLHCLADDAKVVGFYSKREFLGVERISAYYDFGGQCHDALVMVREVMRVDPAVAGARKGNRKGNARAWQERTLWNVLCGTTPGGALEGQDDLDDGDGSTRPSSLAFALCGQGRSISSSGCCIAGVLGTCVAFVLLVVASLHVRG